MGGIQTRDLVKRWLVEEFGSRVTVPAQMNQEFEWHLVVDMNGLTTNVFKAKPQPYLTIQFQLALSGEHLTNYRNLPADEKVAFRNTVSMMLVPHVPDFEVAEHKDGGVFVVLRRYVYPEDMSRQSFWDALRQTQHLAVSFIFIARDYLGRSGFTRA